MILSLTLMFEVIDCSTISNEVIIIFAIELHSNLHFVSEFSCGFDANVTSNPLAIQSPFYPDASYPNGVFCEWNLMSSTPGYKIMVNLIDFDVEDCCDLLKVSQSDVKCCYMYTSIFLSSATLFIVIFLFFFELIQVYESAPCFSSFATAILLPL